MSSADLVHRNGLGSALCRSMKEAMSARRAAALALAALTGAASAQSRTFYDSSGKVVGRCSTSSSGTVTNYDARGHVASAPEDLRRQQITHRTAERG